MFPLDSWTFIALGTDVLAGIQYGFRYRLGSSSAVTPTIIFKTRPGTFYALTSAATFMWTKDSHTSHCNCNMRYVRVYTDYIPYNQDMMISLALMNPDSIY